MVPAVFTDHIARAQSRLTAAFRNQPNCQNILASLVTGVPEMESVLWGIAGYRILSNLVTGVHAGNPTADQLDLIGALVGESRQGRTDAAYLPAIQVRIFVNRSQGRAEDIIQLLTLFGVPFTYTETPGEQATFRVDAFSVLDAQVPVIITAIKHTREAGTHGQFSYTSKPSAPVIVGGHVTSAPLIWNTTCWADTIGSTDLTSWTSLAEA